MIENRKRRSFFGSFRLNQRALAADSPARPGVLRCVGSLMPWALAARCARRRCGRARTEHHGVIANGGEPCRLHRRSFGGLCAFAGANGCAPPFMGSWRG